MYIIVLVIVRMMGKRQLGELQPFELVITFMLADFAVIPLTSTNLPLLNGVIPLLTLSSLHYLCSLLSRKSIKVRNLLCGNPVIIINENGLDYEKLKQLNMNISDIEEALHGNNYFDISQIKFAIVETNGKITVIPKADYENAKLIDLGVKAKDEGLAFTIIEEGKLVTDNIKLMNLSEKFIVKQLKKAKIKSLKDVFVMTLDNNGKVYIQSKYDKPIILETALKSKVEK
ncbi:MAG: DUF421 domain-containing protein [Clostridia bacterium]|nr:DUF421 domain-containing protein [Clostridia bacterium]MDD4275396.1 DUF421 domain-containing protein [Clostridia bacterium]